MLVSLPDLITMACFITGVLGTLLGLCFWVACIDKESSRKGFRMLLVCAPLWYIGQQSLEQKHQVRLEQANHHEHPYEEVPLH